MVTKEVVKAELEYLQDEYVEVVYKVIKALEMPLVESDRRLDAFPVSAQSAWEAFVDRYAGCLKEAPIARGEQGTYEMREELHVLFA